MVAPALVRQMTSGTPETPMSKFMPQIAAIPRQTFNAIVGLAGSAIIGTATSGPVKSLVSSFADKLVVEEAIVKIEDLDPSYWAYWLASTGYSSSAGEALLDMLTCYDRCVMRRHAPVHHSMESIHADQQDTA